MLENQSLVWVSVSMCISLSKTNPDLYPGHKDVRIVVYQKVLWRCATYLI